MRQDPESTPPLSYTLTRLSRQIGRNLAELPAYDLSGPQVTALVTLHHEPGLSNAQLARRCFVTPQSMNEVVIELERRKLLAREPDPSNHRILRAQLTRSGKKVIDAWEARTAELEQRLLGGFSEQEARRFRRSVARAARNLGVPLGETRGPGSTEA